MEPLPGFSEWLALWTARSSSTAHFFAFEGVYEASDIKSVRVAWALTHVSGDINVLPAYQVSDDGVTWPSSTTTSGEFTGTPRTSEGTTYNTSFEDISSGLTKKYVRFGLRVKNNASSDLQHAFGAIRTEVKPA